MEGRTLPVVEIFGPTIQGEGIDQGIPAYFIRFGGCDYKCVWCDSPQAVDPALVREHAQRLTTWDILNGLQNLPVGPKWVVLTGGNPCLHDLSDLISTLHRHGYLVAVETQATRAPEWLADVDRVCLSPKPLSSQMDVTKTEKSLDKFFERLSHLDVKPEKVFLKIVAFTGDDLKWAGHIFQKYPMIDSCVSLGTYPEHSLGDLTDPHWRVEQVGGADTPETLAMRYQELIASTVGKREFADTRIHLQNHVLAFGHKVGV